MANLLIWGKARDLLAGELPAGVTTEEVANLAELQRQMDGRGALVLAHPAHLEAEKTAVAAGLKDGADQNAVMVAVVELGETDEVLARFPFLDDVLIRPVTGTRLRLRLKHSQDALQAGRAIRQLQEK